MTQERILPKGHKYRSCPSPQEAVKDIKQCLESLISEREKYLKSRIKDCTSIEFARHTERISTLKDINNRVTRHIQEIDIADRQDDSAENQNIEVPF